MKFQDPDNRNRVELIKEYLKASIGPNNSIDHFDLDSSSEKRQSIPFQKVPSKLVNKLRTQPVKQLSIPAYSSIYQTLQIYYKQYLKLFYDNQQLNNQLVDIISQRNNLAQIYNHKKQTINNDDQVKRKRRYAKDIKRNFYCPIEKCQKGYGSEGSLTHHVRLKHKQFFQSGEYQIFIEEYLKQIEGIPRQDDSLKQEPQKHEPSLELKTPKKKQKKTSEVKQQN